MREAAIRMTILLVTAVLCGCAATGVQDRSDLPDNARGQFGIAKEKLQRRMSAATQAGWVYARTAYENPVNRPVTHVASLASLALKSAGGAMRRVVINSAQMPALKGDVPPVANGAPMNLAAFEGELDGITGTRSSAGTIRFLVDGDSYFRRLRQAIATARESVDIRTYIFDNDDVAVDIARQLKERSGAVRIRIMLDGLGNMMALQTDTKSIPSGHKSPPSMHSFLESGSKIRVRRHTNPWLTGDHTKTTIIDRKTAFVGGMNIGREYRYEWHDLMMEVTGPVVDKLQFENDKAWARAGPFGDFANFFAYLTGMKQRAEPGGVPVRVLQTRNFDSDIHKAQIAAIRRSKSYILIENAYFSDDRTILELARARRRGVDVRVIIPAAGNHGPTNASNRVTINTLLQHGIRVYRYPGMSHVKAGVFDGWACVGSANLDKLSLKVNKELNLATSDPDTVNALIDQVFIPDILVSSEVKTPLKTTFASRFAEIVVDELL